MWYLFSIEWKMFDNSDIYWISQYLPGSIYCHELKIRIVLTWAFRESSLNIFLVNWISQMIINTNMKERSKKREIEKTAKKATGFNSLRVNCWEINKVTLKWQIDILERISKERSKTEKVHITIGFYIFEIV